MGRHGGLSVSFKAVGTAIAQVRDISGPSLSKGVADVTSADSTKRYREFASAMRDGGEIGLTLVFDPGIATHGSATNGLIELYENDVSASFDLIFTSATWVFDGHVTALEPAAPYEDAVTASVTIKVTGVPVFNSV